MGTGLSSFLVWITLNIFYPQTVYRPKLHPSFPIASSIPVPGRLPATSNRLCGTLPGPSLPGPVGWHGGKIQWRKSGLVFTSPENLKTILFVLFIF